MFKIMFWQGSSKASPTWLQCLPPHQRQWWQRHVLPSSRHPVQFHEQVHLYLKLIVELHTPLIPVNLFSLQSSIVHVLYLSKNAKKSFCEISLLIACFHFFLVVLTESIIILYMYQYTLVFYRFEDAIPDFESVLKLNKDIACAHVNLGLIYMNHYENYHR